MLAQFISIEPMMIKFNVPVNFNNYSMNWVTKSYKLLPSLYKGYGYVYHLSSKKCILQQVILQNYSSLNKQSSDNQNKSENQISEQNVVTTKAVTISNPSIQIRCSGCNSRLQSSNNSKYGFISPQLLAQTIKHNRANINEVYTDKIQNKNTKILDSLHQIQKQTGISIFNTETNKIENLDNLQVLMRLEQNINKYEQQEQLKQRSSRQRKDLLCFRCWSLKYHNRLPEQYDNNQNFTMDSTEFILNKVFNRHRNNQKIGTHYFLVVDVYDILGTMPKDLLHRLIKEKLPFSIIINKIDIVNKQYLDEVAIHSAVKKVLNKHLLSYENEDNNSSDGPGLSASHINIFYLSSKSRQGFKKLEKFMVDVKGSIQLVGLPNTGKTTLVNSLARIRKSTSKMPGTTIKITEHEYGRGKNRKIFDMPGLYYPHLLYNLITKPSIKSMLTWQKKVAPGIMTHSAFIYAGKVEIQGVRIIVFGLGGACSSDNKWFVSHMNQFWKGLPPPNQLKIKKYQFELEFKNGITDDLQIAGYGFIGFRLCLANVAKATRKLTIYLPQSIQFKFRGSSILTNNSNVFHNKSAITKSFMLERLYIKPKETKKQRKQKLRLKQQKKKSKIQKKQGSSQVDKNNNTIVDQRIEQSQQDSDSDATGEDLFEQKVK